MWVPRVAETKMESQLVKKHTKQASQTTLCPEPNARVPANTPSGRRTPLFPLSLRNLYVPGFTEQFFSRCCKCDSFMPFPRIFHFPSISQEIFLLLGVLRKRTQSYFPFHSPAWSRCSGWWGRAPCGCWGTWAGGWASVSLGRHTLMLGRQWLQYND